MHTRFMTGPLVGLCLLAGAARADVFINEFHYDNSGTDSGENVEIIAPAGTNLSGWSVVLYNGGGGARYATLNLSGSAANQCGGYGTVVVAAPGIQNGSPDGLALVNASGQVVQFLSYEGSFSATDGPAAGLTSSDIGQAETTSTAVGHSLQLSGSGSSAGDFSWQAPSAASFGSCNPGQSFSGGGSPPPSPGELVNGVARSGLAAGTGQALEYRMIVPAGASNLSIATSGGSGDADLYVKFGSAPSTSSYDCRPYKNGNSESCSFATPSAGTYYVMVRAYSSFTGLSLVGSFSEPSAPPPPPPGGATLSKAVPVTGLAAASNSSLSYTFSVPAGASNLSIVSSGGSGDADLYVKFGSAPSTSSYDCRPYRSGNAETCSFAAPQAGTWHVMLRAYSSFSGVSLVADYTPASGGGSGYYAGVNTSSSSALRSSLHAIIDDHTRFPYSASTTDTWDVLEQADQDPLNSSRILDIYKNASYAKAGGGNDFYNREHTWPKSYGFPDDVPSNYPYTDMHMLMLSDSSYNSSRGNLPFGNCTASCTEYPTQANAGQGGGSGSFPGNSNWANGSVWQVWSKLKGDVARAMFYMDVRYEGGTHGGSGAAEPDLRLTDNMSLVSASAGNASVAYMGSLSVLLQWHAEDPPTEAEQLRNALIETYQGNRNPFVDHPEWVGCVFQSLCQ
ncbi:pre-peptidase C-terminal domain-containing protein [Pseudomarimonas arenosa]|uniref:Endonuclease n=1 Tax=Pseudomarimonas arenosa TaxID=2774145 RepID=A0AAW3ZL60_9GAMM|nr:pre-peptidase C-terminal domain-containing protein [Pseudomarimonas arenosa]MBD8526845.1 endonuclease [Pseudomarimonas arenosa]